MTEKQRLLQEIENEVKAMTEEQKQEVLNRAHNARSEEEMHRIVNGLAAR